MSCYGLHPPIVELGVGSAFRLCSALLLVTHGISGLYDLEPIRLSFLNEDLKLTDKDAERNSPAKLERMCLSPLILAVGAKESKEFHRQTVGLANAWKKCGESPELLVMPDHDHFSIATQLGDRKSDLSQKIHAQMGLKHP